MVFENNPWNTLNMAATRVKFKQEPPDEDLSAILDNDIHLSSIDKEAEGLITQQIEEILPTESLDGDDDDDELDDDEQDDDDEDENDDDPDTHCVPTTKLPCSRCDFKAKYKKQLNRHEARHAIKGWYYECGHCEYVTYTRQRLIEHESKHTNTRPFGCEKCDFKCRFRADLYKHQAKHSTVKKFKCPKCDFRTKWCRNIKHHLVKHSEDRPHSCHICGFCFKRIQDLRYHLYRHNDQKPIPCELCDFRCKTNYELKCHSLKHSNIKHFACSYPGCVQRTKTKSDLTKHLKTHNKANNYLCAICGKGFNTLQSLNKHKERHNSLRKFKCDLCDKWFKTKPSLRAHMKIHTGVKPFQCDICQNRYNNKYNMEKHKETHNGDRPYACPICPYGAKISEHLLAHIGSTHGKSYAYVCELCHKPFKRYSQLQVHIKRMHKTFVFSDRISDGRIKIKLEAEADGTISTGTDVFSVKPLDKCNFEPEFKRKRGRPPKNKLLLPQQGHPVPDPAVEHLQNSKSVNVKEEPPTRYKLVTYENGIRLPLASKGFHFNFDKTGKKPISWFMQPENMYGMAAVRQRAYMEKKERLCDKLQSGSVPRVRKKVNVVFCLPSKFADEVAVLEDVSVPDPHKLVITGRHSLKTMRKMRRRIRRKNERLKDSQPLLDKAKLHPHENKEETYASHDVGESSNRSEDEDNVPLSQLAGKTNDIEKYFAGGSAVMNSGLQSRDIETSDAAPSNDTSSHIKLVLKRKRKGKFKVTMNISEVPVVENRNIQVRKSKCDLYNGGVRILRKSLRDSKKINISAPELSTPAIRKCTPKKNTLNQKAKQSNKKLKNKKAKESNNRFKISKGVETGCKKAAKKSKKTNSKSKRINETLNNVNTIVNSGNKSKHNGNRRRKPGTVRNTKPSENQNTNPDENPTQHLMMPEQCDEFPIKIEPPDDDAYLASIGWKPSQDGERAIKEEDMGGNLANCRESLPRCSPSPRTGAEFALGYPCSEWSAPFKYLYNVQHDETMAETNYKDHAIAWGLKEEEDVKPLKPDTGDVYIALSKEPHCEAVPFEYAVMC